MRRIFKLAALASTVSAGSKSENWELDQEVCELLYWVGLGQIRNVGTSSALENKSEVSTRVVVWNFNVKEKFPGKRLEIGIFFLNP